MHTDEYEISIGREIAICRERVRQLQGSLAKLERQCGLTAEALLQALKGGRLLEQPPIQSWNREYQELQFWQKMLREYEKVLEDLQKS